MGNESSPRKITKDKDTVSTRISLSPASDQGCDGAARRPDSPTVRLGVVDGRGRDATAAVEVVLEVLKVRLANAGDVCRPQRYGEVTSSDCVPVK
jgi:hypothetical protein